MDGSRRVTTRGFVRLTRSSALLVLVCVASPASAQSPDDPAEAAFIDGKRLYDLREWDQAIARFKEAYKLRADAAYLFNIAQAYRLKGDCLEAQNFYKTFQRLFPNEKAVAKAEKFIASLDECARQRAAAMPANEPVTTPAVSPSTSVAAPVVAAPVVAAPVVAAPVKPSPPITHDRARGGGGLRVAGLVVGGLGVAAIGTGVWFGLQAQSKADDLTSSPVWDQQLYDSGRSADRNAKILIGAGGAAVIGGVVMFLMGRSASDARVGVVPTRSGAALVWSCEL